MRIAIIADVHGNLLALEAVLADLANAGIDHLVCLGDVTALGPHPHEVATRLHTLGCPCVLGNCDEFPLTAMQTAPTDAESLRWYEIESWGAAQLTEDDLRYLHTFEPTLSMPLDGEASLLCFHGSPRSTTDSIVATTPEDTLTHMLGGSSAAVFAGGHTHSPFMRRYQDAVILNPGNVGFSYERRDDWRGHPPWAEYAILDWRAGQLFIEMRRVPIDVDGVVQALRECGIPHAEWLASMWSRPAR